MIKKYLQFLKENIENIENKYHSLGEWVEELCSDKDILDLLKQYLDDTNPTVKIANTVNTLTKQEQNSIYKLITDYLNNTGRKTEVRAIVDMTQENLIIESETNELKAGKNVFNSFLKVITALGLKDIKSNWDNIPDDFLLYFLFKSDTSSIKEKFERFPSLTLFIDKIPENCSLYYGIKNDMSFSFGFKDSEDKLIEIGSFKMSLASIKYLSILDSPSAAHLKRELAYLHMNNLSLIAKISRHMKKYHPGETEKRTFKLNDGILEFGYYGLGKWSSGKIEEEELASIKKGFNKHLVSFKEHDKLLAAISGANFWIKFSIKIK